MVGGAVAAAEWTITPGVELGATYVDNVALAPNDLEEDDYVYEVNPTLVLAGQGRRLGVDFRGRMQNIFYQDNTSDDDTFYQLDGGVNAELVRENLFLDARAARFQTIINANGIIPPSNLLVTDNRTDVTAYNIGPRFTTRVGDRGEFNAAYRYDRVLYGDESDAGGDTAQQQITSSLSSGERYRNLVWGVAYDGRRFTRDGDNDTDTYQQVNLGGDYAVNPEFTLLGAVGYEDNDIAGTANQGGGTTWDAGFIWTPNPRTTLGGSYGNRFYGNTKSAFLSRFTRRVTWRVTYREDVTNNAGRESNRPVFDEDGAPIFDPSAPGVRDDVFVEKRGDADLQIRTGRTALGFRAIYGKREYQSGLGDERYHGGDVIWGWDLGYRTRSLAVGEVIRRKFDDQADDDLFWSTRVGLVRDLTQSVFASLFYYHAKQDSDAGGIDEYVVNAVQIRLTALFGDGARQGSTRDGGVGRPAPQSRTPGRTY
jgi:hypothetical protein